MLRLVGDKHIIKGPKSSRGPSRRLAALRCLVVFKARRTSAARTVLLVTATEDFSALDISRSLRSHVSRFGRPPKDPRPDCGAAGILRRPFDHSRPALSAFRTWAGDAGMSPSGPSGTCPACQAMSALGGKPEVHALDPFVTSQFGPKRTFGSIHGHKKVPDDAGGLLP
jgi:hypothetical protein